MRNPVSSIVTGPGSEMRVIWNGQEIRVRHWCIYYYIGAVDVTPLGGPPTYVPGQRSVTVELTGAVPAAPGQLPELTGPPAADTVTHVARSCCCRNCPGDCR